MEARIIKLPKIEDERGNISFIESIPNGILPFEISRAYWIYDVAGGKERYGRALCETIEFIVALSGSFDVEISDEHGNCQVYHLCRSYQGLLIPSMYWRVIRNFSTNSVALVLASTTFNEADYIRDLSKFKK